MKRFFLFLGMLALGLQASSYERYTDAQVVVWHFNINGTEAQIIDVYYYGDNLTIPSIVYKGSVGYTVTKVGYSGSSNWGLFHGKSIKTVYWPSTVKEIYANTFYNCKELKKIEGIENCTSIGENAFANCYSLETLTFSGETVPTLTSSNAISPNTTVIVPAELLESFRNADAWKDVTNQIIANGVRTDYDISVVAQENTSDIHAKIGERNLDNVMTLKVSGSINGYDIMILRNKMHNLHHLDLSDANIVANDNYYEYYGSSCIALDNTFGSNSFREVYNLYSVKLPKTITTIYPYAFYDCRSLTSVQLYGNLKSIYSSAFSGIRISSIVIPEGVSLIDQNAFVGCPLVNISLPSTLKRIGGGAFSGHHAKNIILPPNLSVIGGSAFRSDSLEEIHIPSMVTSIGDEAFSGSNLKDVWTYTLVPQSIGQNTFSTYTSATLHVQKTSYNNYYWDTQWSQFSLLTEFDGTYSQWLINNQVDYVIDDNTGVINTDSTATGEVEPGSGFISENENDDQNMDGIVVDDDGSSCGSVIGNGHLWCNWLQFLINIINNKWYFLSFPYRVHLSDIICDGDWVIRWYDGASRASTGGTGWRNLPAGTEWLEPGVGYIFQCNKSGKLNVRVRKENLNMNPDDQHNNMTAHPSDNKQHASWNFMGNPFTSYFDMDYTGYECPITYWDGSKYVAVRPGDDDYHFRPFQAFFVQKPDNVSYMNFPKNKRETYNQSKKASQAKAMRRAMRGVNPDRLLIDLTLSNGTETDKARVVFNDKKQNVYEMDCDASKFLSTGVPQLYTVDNQKVQYAINERPNGGVQVGYTANAAGTYTIEATRMDKPMLLQDNKLGITFDLSNGAYEFESAVGTFNNRFTLVENGNATGIADVRAKTGVSVMPTHGGLCISGAEGKNICIYNADGKLMSENNNDGLVALQRGTYVVSVGGMKAKVVVK